jgi:hypothetical protein
MQKTEVPGVYKVSEGVLINRDYDALKAYKKRKVQAGKLRSLEVDICNIKSDLSEIKNLLKGLTK